MSDRLRFLRAIIGPLGLCGLAACAAQQASPSAPPPTRLVGTDWMLVSAGDKTVPAGSPELQPPFLRLQPDGRAMGFSAVNGFNGAYRSSGSSLEVGPLAMTRRAGSPVAMEIEAAMMQSLDAARGYRIVGSTLELLGADGNPVARFEAKPAP